MSPISSKWWFENNSITNRPLLINRAFGACKPSTLSSTVDNKKFWITIDILKSKFNFNFVKDPEGNWYSANVELTAWLDVQLDKTLSKKTSDPTEKHVWRNIFVWLIFDHLNPNQILPPNELVKKEKPKNGLTKVPEHKGTFN